MYASLVKSVTSKSSPSSKTKMSLGRRVGRQGGPLSGGGEKTDKGTAFARGTLATDKALIPPTWHHPSCPIRGSSSRAGVETSRVVGEDSWAQDAVRNIMENVAVQ
jgi:hypothetical protein